MNVARRAWSRLLAFVEARESASSLALVRIAIGLTLGVHVARFWLSGAAAFDAVDVSFGGLGRAGPFGPLSPVAVTLLCATTCLASLSIVLGFGTRIGLALAWASFRTISASVGLARGSYDSLMVDTLVVLFFSGCGRAFSVDKKLFPRDDDRIARWPRVLLLCQMAWLYLGSALSKFGSGWVPGGDASAVWFILHDAVWARFGPPPSWAWHLTQLATTMVWLWELSSPLFVVQLIRGRWARATTLWLLFGVSMHLGIELFMRVGPFSFAALALYFAAISPDRIRPFRGAVSSPSPAPAEPDAGPPPESLPPVDSVIRRRS
jgi:hypothetical protein